MALSIFVITNASTDTHVQTLIKLLDSPLRDQYSPLVIYLAPFKTEIKRQFEEIGVPVCVLERDQPTKLRIVVKYLVRHWRKSPPKIIQGWDDGGNVLATTLWLLSGRKAQLIWGLMNEKPTKTHHWQSRLLLKLAKYWSKYPNQILFKNTASRIEHGASGYSTSKSALLSEMTFNIPDPSVDHQSIKRQALLERLKLPQDTFLIGCVAAYDTHFDYETLLQAAVLASLHYPTMRWVWAGDHMDYQNRALYNEIKNYGLEQHVFLLGAQTESTVNDIVAALDVATLASRLDNTTGFLIKAMTYAIPVVTTEIKALNALVTTTGTLVPHAQPQQFTLAWGEYYHMSPTARRACGLRARQQVLERYTLQTMIDTYQAVFTKLATS
ncbi:MAG: hypothetical protein RLZZ422_1123 [Pseudomonadota bacterium]|jgi:glycosyltransferase involved in cell wall biosynthesis